MRPLLSALALTFAITANAQVATPTPQSADLHAPVAAKRPHTTQIHGYTLTDDYFWLREKTNPSVRAHLEAENAYTAAVMQPTEGLQKRLYDEMLARVKQTDQSVPYRNGAYVYYSRTVEGQQYTINCRKKAGSDVEEVLLDQNEMAKGLGFFSVGAFSVSDDGNFLAFTTDTTGYRQYTLHVKDLRTGQMLSDRMARTVSVVWASDNRTLFLTTEDSVTKRNDNFWRHTVGSTENTLLYHEPDELFDVFAYRSENRRMIFVGSYAKTMSEAA